MRIDQIVPAAIGMTVFGVPGLYLARLLVRSFASKRWPVAKGRITRSKVVPSTSKKGQASASIAYEYEVAGKTYSSDVVCFGGDLDFGSRTAADAVASFAEGQLVEVRHHPRTPDIATLRTKVSGFLVLWTLLCLGAVGSIAVGLITETDGVEPGVHAGSALPAEAPLPPGP